MDQPPHENSQFPGDPENDKFLMPDTSMPPPSLEQEVNADGGNRQKRGKKSKCRDVRGNRNEAGQEYNRDGENAHGQGHRFVAPPGINFGRDGRNFQPQDVREFVPSRHCQQVMDAAPPMHPQYLGPRGWMEPRPRFDQTFQRSQYGGTYGHSTAYGRYDARQPKDSHPDDWSNRRQGNRTVNNRNRNSGFPAGTVVPSCESGNSDARIQLVRGDARMERNQESNLEFAYSRERGDDENEMINSQQRTVDGSNFQRGNDIPDHESEFGFKVPSNSDFNITGSGKNIIRNVEFPIRSERRAERMGNQEAHAGRGIAEADAKPSGKQIKCFTCGEEGHGKRQCSKNHGRRYDNRNSNAVEHGRTDHVSYSGVQQRTSQGRPPIKCYACGVEGHISLHCPNPPGYSGDILGQIPPPILPVDIANFTPFVNVGIQVSENYDPNSVPELENGVVILDNHQLIAIDPQQSPNAELVVNFVEYPTNLATYPTAEQEQVPNQVGAKDFVPVVEDPFKRQQSFQTAEEQTGGLICPDVDGSNGGADVETQKDAGAVVVEDLPKGAEHRVILVYQTLKMEEILDIVLKSDYKETGGCICPPYSACTCLPKLVILVKRKITAECLRASMATCGIQAASIYSSMNDHERTRSLAKFKYGDCRILLALTSEAEEFRGSFANVQWLIVCDMPPTIEEYKALVELVPKDGKALVVTTFYDRLTDCSLREPLIQVIVDSNNSVPEWLRNETSESCQAVGDENEGDSSEDELW